MLIIHRCVSFSMTGQWYVLNFCRRTSVFTKPFELGINLKTNN